MTMPYFFNQYILLACLLLLASPALLLAQVQLKVGIEQNPPICSIEESDKPQGISVNNAAIVQAITALAAALRLHVVVEGVESTEQALFLKTAGLDTAQGFLYSRPVSALMLQSMMLEMSPLYIQR
jgi:hypothetical protein